MRHRVFIVAGLLSAAGAAQATAGGPPMDQFNSAFYVCEAGKANFAVSYSGDKLNAATVTTSAKAHYALQKAASPEGYLYDNGDGVRFWTDGKKVTLTGTPQSYSACKLQVASGP